MKLAAGNRFFYHNAGNRSWMVVMRKVWRRMVAWALVGVLVVELWAMPGWARKGKEEKPKPIEGEIAGLLAALEDEWPEVKGLAFERFGKFDRSH